MNSCLYLCDVMHYRLSPVKNRFAYKLFMFYLDLDEIPDLFHRILLIGRRFNAFTFREQDHLPFNGKPLKESVLDYARVHGVDLPNGKVFLLTHLRTFGYIFNPVSFYLCFDQSGTPRCTVVEVGNTFREMKPYFIGPANFQDGQFHLCTTKYFYVSPFIDLTADFDFKVQVPGERLAIFIDDIREGKKFFLSSLTGVRKPLNNGTVTGYALRFPLITLRIIFLIHWQALILHKLKKLPYHRKAANPHLQREVHHA